MKYNLLKKTIPFFGLGLLLLIIYKIGVADVLQELKKVKVFYLCFVPFLTLSLLLIQTLKWRIILSYQGMAVDFKKLFGLIMIGMFYGSITPGQLGGFIKIKYLSDIAGVSIGQAGSGVMLDKMIDVIVLFLFASAGAIILSRQLGGIWLLFLTILLLAVLFVFFYQKNVVKKIVKILPLYFLSEKIRSYLRKNFNLFYENMPQIDKLILPFLLSIVSWLLIYTQVFFISRSISVDVSYSIFIFVIAIASVVALLPITISGIGTKDICLLAILSVYGVPPERIIGMSLLTLTLCVYLPAFIGGLINIIGFNRSSLWERQDQQSHVGKYI